MMAALISGRHVKRAMGRLQSQQSVREDQPSLGMYSHNKIMTQRYSWRNTASQTSKKI
jgi:hypothetical protein